MALAFLIPFTALVGLFAASGRSFIAIWHEGPVTGASYRLDIALSPEVLVFVFFMISDPQTAPKAQLGRIIYGGATALVAAGLLFFQPTEFGIKVAILSSLTAVCALVPLIERISERIQRHGSAAAEPETEPRPLARRLAAGARQPAVVAVAIIAVGATVDTAALAGNKQVILIERGQTGSRNAQ